MGPTSAVSGVSHAIIGGYTAEMEGGAVGVSTVALAGPAEISAVPLTSPSYLVKHPSRPWVFAVSEGEPGHLTSLALDADTSLSVIGSTSIGGDAPCHLAFTPRGEQLVVANYGSGSVSSFGILPDGQLTDQLDLLQFTGHGPDPDRQRGPHAHQVVWDRDELLVCDLGTDQIHRLAIDDEGRLSHAADSVRLPRGSGPRHLVRIGDFLVVACELSARLWLGRRTATGWEAVLTVSASTAQPDQPIYPSAIVAQGDRVFVANRGAGTVAVFDLDQDLEVLRFAGEFDCGGVWPRDLKLSPGRLWVANQTDDRVSVFATAGVPSAPPAFEFSSPAPACLVLLEQGQDAGC